MNDNTPFKNVADDFQKASEEININDEYTPPREEKDIFDILKTKTGEGSIEKYIDDPLNFDNSKETAQIIRGLNGFVSDTDLAMIDITFGLIKKFSPKKVGEKENG